MASRALAKGAVGGLLAGLLACPFGASYMRDLIAGPYSETGGAGISWTRVACVFVVQLCASGALVGALLHAARRAVVARRGADASFAALAWSCAASILAALVVAVPSGAFGAAYFGSLNAPYMGNSVLLAMPGVIAIALTTWLAWLDGAGTARPLRRFSAAFGASVTCALPVAAVFAMIVRAVPDDFALAAMRGTSLAMLGATFGAAVGAVLGVYVALVTHAARIARKKMSEPRHARIAIEPTDESVFEDPLAVEEAELEARFAELDRRERRV